MTKKTGHPAFADTPFGRVASIIHREAGIVLGPEKASMMRARLGKRIAQTGAGDLAGYVRLLEGPAASHEMPNLISALTTNVTHFFREAHHFDFLRHAVLPEWQQSGRRPLHIWSAGCSSGQEPFSIAMTLAVAGTMPGLSVLATDIDTQVLKHAIRAEYSDADIASVPQDLVTMCFDRIEGAHRVIPSLRTKVQFRQLNLHADWRLTTKFDVIFCRNVVIYFDSAARTRLWDRFLHQLRPGGWLIIGHSERVPAEMRGRLRPAGQTIYQSHANQGVKGQ